MKYDAFGLFHRLSTFSHLQLVFQFLNQHEQSHLGRTGRIRIVINSHSSLLKSDSLFEQTTSSLWTALITDDDRRIVGDAAAAKAVIADKISGKELLKVTPTKSGCRCRESVYTKSVCCKKLNWIWKSLLPHSSPGGSLTHAPDVPVHLLFIHLFTYDSWIPILWTLELIFHFKVHSALKNVEKILD